MKTNLNNPLNGPDPDSTTNQRRFSVILSRRMASVLLATILAATSAFAGSAGNRGKRSIETMTVNLYVGGGTGRVLALDPSSPGYITNLVATVTGIYYEIAASDPAVRMSGVAEAIAARHPDVVAVQEASLIRNQSPGDLVIGGTVQATNVVFDYLQLLVAALAARGEHYEVASSVEELDVELPMFNLQTGVIDDARLTDRDAILVRTDLPAGQLRVTHPHHGHFSAVLQIPSTGLTVERGWCSVDLIVRGQPARYICSHLEEETVPQIQLLQAQELLAGPAHVDFPVILAGDFNADTFERNGTQTYAALVGGGFSDAWAATHPAELVGGLTWGHDEFLDDPNTAFVWRIDLILYRGAGLAAGQAEVIDLGLRREQAPLWASDHAAVAARLELQQHHGPGHHRDEAGR
jgi:endonuclease/exonuclease/phosphatase family metal-dependent hydrolase